MTPEIEHKNHKIVQILLHAAFFVSGIATILIGVLLPMLSRRFSLDDGQLAMFFPAQFAGSLLGTTLSNLFGRRGNFLLASVVGCILMAVGVFTMNAPLLSIVFTGFFINGMGVGLTLPSINLYIVETNLDRVTAALNTLNFYWGFGAILTQPFVSLVGAPDSFLLPTALIALSFLVFSIVIFALGKDLPRVAVAKDGSTADELPIWTTLLAWIIALFNFVHVGFESAIGGWLESYTERIGGAAFGARPVVVYFALFVIGRGAASRISANRSINQMLIGGLLIIVVGLLLLLAASGQGLLIAGAALCGFGTSWIFPTNLARFNSTFGAGSSRRATPLFVCGTLGATATTWLIGFISKTYDNNLRAGMMVLMGSILTLILVQASLTITGRKQNT